MKLRKLVLFLLVPFTVSNPSVHAQMNRWEEIGQLGLGIQCGYFWNRDNGVIATGDGQYYYMKNGGGWKAGQKLPKGALVNSIRCFDGSTLYSPVLGYANTSEYELWRSTDSGVTWNQLSAGIVTNGPGDNGPDVYWNYRLNGPVLRGSTDVRLDSLDIISTWDYTGQGPPTSSLDGGLTWGTGTLTKASIYYNYYSGCGGCADQINKLYYATAEAGYPGMFRSSDSGRSWTCLTSLPQNLFMMDDVEGLYDKTFIQTSQGMYETTDSGNTWNAIGGPSRANSDDSRFFVFGCTGQAVVAFDDQGGIWIMNGWDAPDPEQLQSTFSATAQECDTTTILVTVAADFMFGRLLVKIDGDTSIFTLLSPDTINVDSSSQQIVIRFVAHDLVQHNAEISLTPIDFGGCAITHPIIGQAHLAPLAFNSPIQVLGCAPVGGEILIKNPNCELLQIIGDSSKSPGLVLLPLVPISSDTAAIPFTCLSLPKNGESIDTVEIRGFFQPSNTNPFDTTVIVKIIYQYIPSTLAASETNYDLGTITQCLSADSSFVLQNTGCDTLYIPLSQYGLATGWTLTPATDTLELLPGQFDTIHIHFSSLIPGVHNQVLTYNYFGAHSGVVSISMSASVTAVVPAVTLSDTAIDLGTRTICANDTTIDISFTDLGCDSISFTNFQLGSGTPFQLVNADDTIVPPNGIVHKNIIYHGAQDGSESQTLTVHISRTDGSFGRDTSIHFSVNVTGQLATLQTQTSAIDVGQTYICEERDTSVVIQNIGCDTVCITGVSVVPTNFIVTSADAFCIAPGEQDTIALLTQIDTTGGTLANHATLTFTSSPLTSLGTIALSREIVYPVTWGLHLSPPDSAIAGADVTFQVIQSGSLPPDITALDLTLAYEDDLLGFVRAEEPSVSPGAYVRTATGLANQNFQIAPVGNDSILATLHFFPYLTVSSQTAIDIENLSLVSSLGRSQDCIASVATGQTEFTLRSECGYGEIQGFLDSGRVFIDAIVPNPSTDVVQISFINPTSSAISYQLFDALGQTRMSGVTASNALSLDVSSLPEGIYFFRATNGSSFSASNKLAIVR